MQEHRLLILYALRADQSLQEYVNTCFHDMWIVPLQMAQSPVLTILALDHQKEPWIPIITDSCTTVYRMLEILWGYMSEETEFYEKNQQLCDELRDFMKSGIINLHNAFADAAKTTRKKDSWAFFVQHTFNVINHLEYCLYVMFMENVVDATFSQLRSPAIERDVERSEEFLTVERQFYEGKTIMGELKDTVPYNMYEYIKPDLFT